MRTVVGEQPYGRLSRRWSRWCSIHIGLLLARTARRWWLRRRIISALPARSWLVCWGLSGRRGTYGAAPLCPTHLGRRQSPRRLRAQTAALPRLRAQGETEVKRIKVVHQGTPSVRRKKSASVKTLLRPRRTYRCALPGPSSAPGEVAQPNQSGRTVPTTWFI